MALFGLAAVSVANRAEGRECFTVKVGDAFHRTCDELTFEGDGVVEWDCRRGQCDLCGVCHAATPPQVRANYPSQSHILKYRYNIKLGERISWAHGLHVTIVGGRKCIIHKGRAIYCFPANAVVVKNPQGQPVGIFTPHSQTRPTVPKKP